MNDQFHTLRIIGSVFKWLGIMTAALTVILALITIFRSNIFGISNGLRAGSITEGLMVGLAFILKGGGLAFLLYAAGEVIAVLLTIEERTR